MFSLAAIPTVLKVAAAAVLAAAALAVGPANALAAPPAATGVTAIALNNQVTLAWQPVFGASGYAVYRGTSVASITQLVSSSAVPATTFTDATAVNGTTYFYAVRSRDALSAESGPSAPVSAKPLARSCSSGLAVVVENCFAGSTGWKLAQGTRAYDNGIEGFASATSINAGDSVNLKVATKTENAPYHIDVYRTGWYGGAQGRLISSLPNLRSTYQPGCRDGSDIESVDCSNWSITSTLTTTTDWVSGVYLLRLVRDDNGQQNEMLLVVRNDGNRSDVAYSVPDTTYQAYNSYGGRSLYSWSSSNRQRARKVSFDRPYNQPNYAGTDRFDWYSRTDVATVSWLERNGYDTTYLTATDVHSSGAQVSNHDVFISGSHDEYWSSSMVNAVTAARDAGTSLSFMGANAVYWKIRFENSPSTGAANRVEVTYKSIESPPTDPVEPTSTWRDPNGGNRPENGLIGIMYIGDNDNIYFPLKVSEEEGKNRIWRHTPVASLAPGSSVLIGTRLVGWEWDSRVANGREPAGLQTLASSPVTGALVQGNGGSYIPNGSAVQNTSIYRAGSGAQVFATGTNHWARGLALNADGVGEPDSRIQQATTNVMIDGGAVPTTPASGMVVDDGGGAPSVASTTPASGATSAPANTTVKAVFDREIDPATVTTSTFRLFRPNSTAVAATVAMDNGTRTATLTPGQALDPFTTYTARLETAIKGWSGAGLAAAYIWTFTTGGGSPPTVTSRTPAAGATSVPVDTAVRAVFDRSLDPTTVTGQTAKLTTSSGAAVAAQVAYDNGTRTVTITPAARLGAAATYTATLTTGIQATDGTPLSAPVTWSFTTGNVFTVSSRAPTDGATGVATSTTVRATFSRDVDQSTLSSSSFTLTNASGQTVAGTVTYDQPTRTATLTPNQGLSLAATYTARVAASLRASDGAPLDAPSSWSFTTASATAPPPVAGSLSPAANSTAVAIGASARATFDRALDPATVTTQSFTLTPDGGPPVTATVGYDDATRTVTLQPSASLATGTRYTARLTTAIRSSAGAPLAADVVWSFTTADCPCSLMSALTPSVTGLPVADGRPGPGPFTYEMGTRVAVDRTSNLIALRYYRDPGETGTHIGRVWSSTGAQLAQVTFSNETASGWQRQSLPTSLSLQSGQEYTVSIGLNSRYTVTQFGLQTQLVSGPLKSVADGANGVYNNAAGNFPNRSFRSSNYFVDAVVTLPGGTARTPAVTSTTPAAGASGVSTSTRVEAAFNVPLDSSSISTGSFTLTGAGGQSVSATVSYDNPSQTATLRPSGSLSAGTTYTARLTTAIRSDDGTPLPAPMTWSFSTAASVSPSVTAVSPTDGATQIGLGSKVSATFNVALDAATVTGSSFGLSGPGGTSVAASASYDSASRTATLTPAAALSGSSTYTATLTTGIKSSAGVAMEDARTWSFSTNNCPCRLFGASLAPVGTGFDTRDGRTGPGPWSYELGVKVQVSRPSQLVAARFWKDPGETGSHRAELWSPSGTLLATTTFSGESASGWQQQAFSPAVTLDPNQTYTVSVNANAFFVSTTQGLAQQITSGPLSSVVGANGVFAEFAGALPTSSYRSSNYFVDAVVQ